MPRPQSRRHPAPPPAAITGAERGRPGGRGGGWETRRSRMCPPGEVGAGRGFLPRGPQGRGGRAGGERGRRGADRARGRGRQGRERGAARGRALLRSPRARAGGRGGRAPGSGGCAGSGSCGHQSTVAIAAFDVIVRVVPLLPGLVIGGNPVSAEPL